MNLSHPPVDTLAQAAEQAAAMAPAAPARGVLSFQLGEQTYAVDVRRVREIRRYEKPTRIAGARADVLGLIDLRGTVVPVIDLRLRLDSGSADVAATTSVVVIEIGRHLVGAVVDLVSDVVDLEQAALHPVPPLESGRTVAYLRGLATVGDQMLLLLDVDALLADAVATEH
jgi:purine-binding chemotaxis protein CheW